jgi:hypothetical protein
MFVCLFRKITWLSALALLAAAGYHRVTERRSVRGKFSGSGWLLASVL